MMYHLLRQLAAYQIFSANPEPNEHVDEDGITAEVVITSVGTISLSGDIRTESMMSLSHSGQQVIEKI